MILEEVMMTAREFLEKCKKDPPQKALELEMKRREAEADAYYEALGELVEKHPIRSPRIGRGCGPL